MYKAVAYLATRDYYEKVLPSLKSLLYHTRVDKVYLLIENDVFPYTLPDNAVCINVKNQQYYRPDGPNMHTRWSYIALLKPILCKLLPEDLDTVLCIDADTIILDDISPVWDLPIEDCYFAASAEPHRCKPDYIYTNIGVALFNLKKLRDGKADEVMDALNTRKFDVVDQDALIEHCQGHIMDMPSCYNICHYTGNAAPPKLRHFAGERDWFNDPLVKCWKNVYFDELQRMEAKTRTFPA